MDDEAIIELYFARNEEAIRRTEQTYGSRLLPRCRGVARRSLPGKRTSMGLFPGLYIHAHKTGNPRWIRFS